MTDNETIAKALGWGKGEDECDGVYTVSWCKIMDDGRVLFDEHPPAYDSDLNLIHSAEDALTEVERQLYTRELVEAGRMDWLATSAQLYFAIRHATAAQCAQALAKVLGGRAHG